MSYMDRSTPEAGSAVLDSAHLGDIIGALGTIRRHDTAARAELAAASCDACSPSSVPA